MRRLLLTFAVLACAATAGATAFDWPNTGSFGRPHRHASAPAFLLSSLPAPSAPASITPQAGTAFTCPRTSTATYQTSATALATAAANTCRVDYRGLLVEESRTNSILGSGLVGGSAWSNSNVTAVSGVTAPDGTTNATTLATTLANGATSQSFTSAVASYSASAWFWVASSTQATEIRLFDGVGNVCKETPTATTTIAEYQCSGAESTSGRTLRPFIYPGQESGSGTVVAWGAQLELGPFASSYIPTTTTAVTRSADQIDVGAITLSATPSLSATVNLEGLPASGTATALKASDGTNSLVLAVDTGGHAKCSYNTTSDTTTGTVTPGTESKIVCKYDGTTLSACIGSTCHGTAASLTPVSAWSHLFLGWDGSANYLNGFFSTGCAAKQAGKCS